MAEVNLLPRKVFEITLEDKTVIRGQFGLWASKRFADKKGLSLSQLLELRDAEKLSLDDICLVLLSAVEYISRQEKKGFPYTDIDACQWIEELGGLLGEGFEKIMAHANSDLPAKAEDEKKSQ